MKDVQDDELIRRIARGDSKAFESLLGRHKKSVYGLATHLMGSKAQGEEIAQETWIRVIRHAEAYAGRGSAKSWILTIARNLALNELRKRQWEEELEPNSAEKIPDGAVSFEDLLSSEEDARRVQTAMLELPDRQRVALVLFLSEDKSHSEIAVELDLQVNAVKALLMRARENLKKHLTDGGRR